jgi:hypothetical protein
MIIENIVDAGDYVSYHSIHTVLTVVKLHQIEWLDSL